MVLSLGVLFCLNTSSYRHPDKYGLSMSRGLTVKLLQQSALIKGQ
jgi:hypothetical protein